MMKKPSEQEEKNKEEHTHTQEEEEHTQTEEEHTDDDDEGQGGNSGENEGNTEENTGISLDEWREYEFHEGHEPAYHEDWDFYYGTTYEPMSNCLWENPNEKVDYNGIEFFVELPPLKHKMF